MEERRGLKGRRRSNLRCCWGSGNSFIYFIFPYLKSRVGVYFEILIWNSVQTTKRRRSPRPRDCDKTPLHQFAHLDSTRPWRKLWHDSTCILGGISEICCWIAGDYSGLKLKSEIFVSVKMYLVWFLIASSSNPFLLLLTTQLFFIPRLYLLFLPLPWRSAAPSLSRVECRLFALPLRSKKCHFRTVSNQFILFYSLV